MQASLIVNDAVCVRTSRALLFIRSIARLCQFLAPGFEVHRQGVTYSCAGGVSS